jgi:hypothetical protein
MNPNNFIRGQPANGVVLQKALLVGQASLFDKNGKTVGVIGIGGHLLATENHHVISLTTNTRLGGTGPRAQQNNPQDAQKNCKALHGWFPQGDFRNSPLLKLSVLIVYRGGKRNHWLE